MEKDYVGEGLENIAPHVEDSIRSKEFEMAEFIRTSYESLSVIPEVHRHLMHSMYEDSDIDGANEAEAVFDFIERVDPGRFVIILANDSVTPPCCNQKLHFNCDYYAPYWYTVLMLKSDWERYKVQVEAKQQEWINSHGCREMPRLVIVSSNEELPF